MTCPAPDCVLHDGHPPVDKVMPAWPTPQEHTHSYALRAYYEIRLQEQADAVEDIEATRHEADLPHA